jgi:uncharacterized membrane protein YdbT with pleckstrin-like domain
MSLSKSIKQTLGNDEQIKKLFSFSNRHIYIRLIFSLIKWLLISAVLATIVFILYKIGEVAANSQGINSLNLNGEDFFKGFILKASLIGAIVFFFIFAPISMFYHLYFLRIANTFVMTNRRVIVKKGWLNTSVKSVEYDRITDVSVDQSFLDKVFYKSGKLSISTAGGDGYELVLNCVHEPHELKKTLSDLKDNYRKLAYPTPPATPTANPEIPA